MNPNIVGRFYDGRKSIVAVSADSKEEAERFARTYFCDHRVDSRDTNTVEFSCVLTDGRRGIFEFFVYSHGRRMLV